MKTEERSAGPTSGSARFPLDRERVRRVVTESRVDPRRASIREMSNLVNRIERAFGVRFVRMEFGIPGLPTPAVAVEAEHAALAERGVGNLYAPFEGVAELKAEASKFARLFMDLELPPKCCIPTIGAMEGCFAALMLAGGLHAGARKVICLNPGFPVNRLQLRLLGLETADLDLYDYRGDSLIEAIERVAATGDACAVLWSSPNNPSWVVLKESELEGIARVCDRHHLLAIEDLAYFGMDTRQDYFVPGSPPYQPTVLRYGHRAISIVSSSKLFSYAGQRIALAFVRPELMDLESTDLVARFGTANVGHAWVHGTLYPIAASVPESPQYGLLALLQAANAGRREVFEAAAEYARRAKALKPMFLDNGFRLVYDNDLGEPLADGFYFTVSHPGFDHGADLLQELLHYGVSAITLETTGSRRVEGVRACVSMIGPDQYSDLRARLAAFQRDHPADLRPRGPQMG